MPLPDLIEIVPLSAPVRAEITVPGSKIITNCALILAALADGEVMLKGALWSEDTQIMVACLQELGFMVNAEPGRVQRSPYQQRQQAKLPGPDHDDAGRAHVEGVRGTRPDDETYDHPGRHDSDACPGSPRPPSGGGPDERMPGLPPGHAAACGSCRGASASASVAPSLIATAFIRSPVAGDMPS